MSDPEAKKVTGDGAKPADNAPVPVQVLSGSAIYEQCHADDRKQRRRRKFQKAPIWIEAACAVALVAITGAYTHYASVQKQAMLDSNDINRRSLYSTQRAFVAFEGISQEVINVTDSSDKVIDKVFEMSAKWTNVGNTPAVDVVITVGFAEEQSQEPIEDMFLGKGHELFTGAAVIGPRQPFQSKDFFKPLSFADPREDQRYIWGFVFYRDTFPDTKPHISEFCNRIVRVEKSRAQNNVYRFTAAYCREHNCIDEFCPDYNVVLTRAKEIRGH